MVRAKIILSILSFSLVLGSCSRSVESSSPEKDSVKVEILKDFHQRYQAGDSIGIVLRWQEDFDVDKPLLLVSSFWNTTSIEGVTSGDNLMFTLPEELSQQAGTVRWTLGIEKQTLADGIFSIEPHSEISPVIDAFIAPPLLSTDRKTVGHAIAIPQDIFGNLITDSLLLKMNEIRGIQKTQSELSLRNGLIWSEVYSGAVPQRVFVGFEYETKYSKELNINIRAGNPIDFELECVATHYLADGNQLTTVRTSNIIDVYGNIVVDGTIVNFSVYDSLGGSRFNTGYTLDGIAQAQFLNPQSPGSYTFTAHISNLAKAESKAVFYENALSSDTIPYEWHGNTITFGPIITKYGYQVADGTEVKMSFNQSEETLVSQIEKGHVVFKIPSKESCDVLQFVLELLGNKIAFTR